MIPVERMGLARDVVKLTPTVGESPLSKSSKYATCERPEEPYFI